MRNRPRLRLADEIRYIQRRAAARDGRVVTADQLVLFSTETGDAWLLDPSDHLAARLARDGDPESIALEETDTSFQIAWPASYRLDGPAFVYTDRHSRRVSTILDYPTQPLTKNIPFCKLVDITKLRWRIERDYQELKQEVGLGHFEGRGWRGFHHHATMCIAAYGFLVSERETIPPCAPRSARLFKELAVPDGYRPRGASDKARASHSQLDRNHAPTAHHCAHPTPLTMSMLHSPAQTDKPSHFVTQ